jgi:hypothetical protein
MNSDINGDTALAIILMIMFLLNILVWFFPERYLDFLKETANLFGPPMRDIYLGIYSEPVFIWLVRIALSIGLAALIYVRIVA